MTEYYGTKRVEAELLDDALQYRLKDEDGCNAWLTKDAFEAHYRQSGELNFGHALLALREGKEVARSLWVGKQYVRLITEGWKITQSNEKELKTHDFLVLRTPREQMVPWLPTMIDVLAEDWWVL